VSGFMAVSRAAGVPSVVWGPRRCASPVALRGRRPRRRLLRTAPGGSVLRCAPDCAARTLRSPWPK
jgi:Tfp pilus assembly protein PilN